jgi:hypothetical protein
MQREFVLASKLFQELKVNCRHWSIFDLAKRPTGMELPSIFSTSAENSLDIYMGHLKCNVKLRDFIDQQACHNQSLGVMIP